MECAITCTTVSVSHQGHRCRAASHVSGTPVDSFPSGTLAHGSSIPKHVLIRWNGGIGPSDTKHGSGSAVKIGARKPHRYKVFAGAGAGDRGNTSIDFVSHCPIVSHLGNVSALHVFPTLRHLPVSPKPFCTLLSQPSLKCAGH